MLVNVINKVKKTRAHKLSIWDVDDTLFKSKAKTGLVRNGELKFLSSKEIAELEPMDGDKFDFSEFRNAEIFSQSKPIKKMLELARARYNDHNYFVLVLSARADLNSKKPVIDKFLSVGIDIEHGSTHFVRAGNYVRMRSPEAKKKVIDEVLATGKFDEVEMYDDHKKNLNAFLTLKEKYPEIKFTSHLVTNGRIS